MRDLLFLVGFMGCGKTTLGRAAAGAAGWDFLDMDQEIERRQGMTVGQIFATRGAPHFRRLERELLEEICSNPRHKPLLVATGGGTPLQEGNMELMNLHGLTLWLQASESRLLARLLEAQDRRPLLRGLSPEQLLDRIRSLQRQRSPYYSQARKTFCADLLENEAEIALTVSRFLTSVSEEE